MLSKVKRLRTSSRSTAPLESAAALSRGRTRRCRWARRNEDAPRETAQRAGGGVGGELALEAPQAAVHEEDAAPRRSAKGPAKCAPLM
jgi:hypothetical protein